MTVVFSFWFNNSKAPLVKYSIRLSGHSSKERFINKNAAKNNKKGHLNVSPKLINCIVLLSEDCEKKRISWQGSFWQRWFRATLHAVFTFIPFSLEPSTLDHATSLETWRKAFAAPQLTSRSNLKGNFLLYRSPYAMPPWRRKLPFRLNLLNHIFCYIRNYNEGAERILRVTLALIPTRYKEITKSI